MWTFEFIVSLLSKMIVLGSMVKAKFDERWLDEEENVFYCQLM